MILKPVLDYIELSITDHCNLKCKGCALFSPLVEEGFAMPENVENDFKRLSELFSSIPLIRLLGGEPLLNPEINKIIKVIMPCFPDSDLHIMTNGLLLPEMSSEFWETLRKYSVEIDLSLYPPLENQVSLWESICKKEKVKLNIYRKYEFKKIFDSTGASSKELAFKNCPYKVSTFIMDGKIAACNVPLTIHYLNNYFNLNISANGSLNIYQKDITGEDILEFLKNPTESCSFCSLNPERYKWDLTNYKLDEWCVDK